MTSSAAGKELAVRDLAAKDPDGKGPEAFRTIGEVAASLNVPQHVLRFWETRFTQIKPLKRAGNRRFYRPADVELLGAIRHLLYGEGYTIKGVQRILREHGPRGLVALVSQGSAMPLPPDPTDGDAGESIEGPIGALRSALAELAACRRLLGQA